MTPHEFTKGLPDARKGGLSLTPPFTISGLSTCVFPLRASLNSLQQLCDSFYNIVPPEVGRLRVVAPYVYLMCMDYGRMSSGVGNAGWFAQHEFMFCLPVEWYKVEKNSGKWVFHDWAMVTPYLYVDDDFSAPLGREVYGWPKTTGSLTPAPSDWLRDPTGPETLVSLVTAVFPELYGGLRLVPSVFLEVERDAPAGNFKVPFDGRSPIAPWVIATNLAQAMAGLGRDALALAQATRIFDPQPNPWPPFVAQYPSFVPRMLAGMGPMFAPGGRFATQCLNLKQFRDAENSSGICYQALTSSPFQIAEFYEGGLLGEERILLGDVSGGYTIRLHDYPSVSIAATLGLESVRQLGQGGVSVLSMKPVLPFWYKVDMTYLPGANLAWRTKKNVWYGESGEPLRSTRNPAQSSDPPTFNTTIGSAVDEVAGPFRFTETARVLPLLARRPVLQSFLDKQINLALEDAEITDADVTQQVQLSVWARPPIQVEPNGPEIGGEYAYVYMNASSFEAMTSETNNVGNWIDTELAFLIPIKWESRKRGETEWKLRGVGLLPAYSFVPRMLTAISRVEVRGLPTMAAEFPAPEGTWMMGGEGIPNGKENLLTVNVEVMPALGEGQEAAMHALITVGVLDAAAAAADVASGLAFVEWAEILRSELATKKSTRAQFPSECKIARALALEVLGNRVPLSVYTLKEFRDAGDPNKACYQSLLRGSRQLDEILDVREIEETIWVRIHDYPTLKIAESLGIVASPIDEGEHHAGITYATQAIRPFYIRARVFQPLEEDLMSRAGSIHWQSGAHPFRSLLNDSPDDEKEPNITVDGVAEAIQDQVDPCWMSSVMRQAGERRRGAGLTWKPSDITKEAARAALGRVDPQMVIESLLSREWGNRDSKARWRRSRLELTGRYDVNLSGAGFSATVAHAQAALYADASLGSIPKPKLDEIVGRLIAEVRTLAELRGQLEAYFTTLAEWAISKSAGAQRERFKDESDDLEILGAVGGLFTTIVRIVNVPGSHDPASSSKEELEELREGLELNTLVLADYVQIIQLLCSVVATAARIVEALIVEAPKTPSPNLLTEIHEELKEVQEKLARRSVREQRRELLRFVESGTKSLQPSDLPKPSIGSFLNQGLVGSGITELGGAVPLVRRYCDAQVDALLDKLARANQKPDFCVKRDSVGPDRDRLLPLSLSWDADWYYGKTMDLSPLDEFPNVVNKNPRDRKARHSRRGSSGRRGIS